jgi:hypothetical protein
MQGVLWGGVSSLVVLLMGCAGPTTIYDWQNYQNNLHTYLRGDKAATPQQIAAMEEDLQKIRASGKPIPPGYQAHLGLLYAKEGNLSAFAQQLDAEKTQYPESKAYMDFLTRNLKK